MKRNTFELKLTVDKEIVSLLSKSTYQRNFPYALREMVSNAYDADATVVRVNVDLKLDEIVIEDDGNGMSKEQLNFFLTIAGKSGGSGFTPKFGRQRIGNFGIGFLSVFPFCDIVEVTSTVQDSDLIFVARIPAGEYFKRTKKPQAVDEIVIQGLSFTDRSQVLEHYTKIRLIKLTDNAKIYLSEPDLSAQKGSVQSYLPLDRFKWELQEDLPLQYAPESTLSTLVGYEEPIGMRVFFNGDQLFRNEVEGQIIARGDIKAGEIEARYVFITPWKPVRPFESRFIKIRVRNVGIGERKLFGLGERVYSRRAHISGEIQILRGASLTMNRDDFIITPDYLSLVKQIGEKLRPVLDEIELVDTSSKSMTTAVRGSKQATVGPKRDVLQRNIETLVSKGFAVKYQPAGKSNSEPVKVDKVKKQITVVADHPDLSDEIRVDGQRYILKYHRMEDAPDIPCRFLSKRVIEVNTTFRLFTSKRYGELFKKLFVIALISQHSSRNPQKMFDLFVKSISEEFQNY